MQPGNLTNMQDLGRLVFRHWVYGCRAQGLGLGRPLVTSMKVTTRGERMLLVA